MALRPTMSVTGGATTELLSPDVSPLDPNRDPAKENHSVVVDLDQIEDEEGVDWNPRLTPNRKYEEIKESIRIRGLDHPVPITQRPGSTKYIRKAGGRTRCRALVELFKETGDYERYGRIETTFTPWVSEVDLVVGHVTENLLRSGLNFYEQANQERKLFEEIAKEDPHFAKAGQREREARYKSMGYSVSRDYLVNFDYIFRMLHPALERELVEGMPIRAIKELRSIEKQLEKSVDARDNAAIDDYSSMVKSAIKQTSQSTGEFDLGAFKSTLYELVAKQLNTTPAELIKPESSNKAQLAFDNTIQSSTATAPIEKPKGAETTTSAINAERHSANTVQPRSPEYRIPVDADDIHKSLLECREASISLATTLANDHGLIKGAFFTVPKVGLGYALEDPDSLQLMEAENGIDSVVVFTEMHSLYWSVLEAEIASGRVKSEVRDQFPNTAPEVVTSCATLSTAPRAQLHWRLQKHQLKAAVDRQADRQSEERTLVEQLDQLRGLANRYVQLLERAS